MPGSEMPGQGGNGLQRGNSLQGGNALQGGSGLQGGRAEGLADLLSLIARLGTQGEEQQEDAVRLQLNTKIMAFFDKFQHMEEKISSLENLVDLKESQLAVLPQVTDEFASDGPKRDVKSAELNIRLELEHDRRVRAQEAIGEIEKERILLKQKLDIRNSDYEQKAQEFDEVKLGCDYKLAKMAAEMKKLETKMATTNEDKDKRIVELQAHNNDLFNKLEEFEERYNNQLDVSRTLQNELQASFVETQSLIKEMEMLNLMFAELEHHIFTQQSKGTGEIEVTENGQVVKVKDVLANAQSTEPSQSLLQESCFNEVNTKHGTKMVLSVSKTFLKLKDLILEKNTLQEQVVKMKTINEHLCSQVNIHEEKLCGITDELNNTWFYVSKIKEQHKKLHSAEQILRAELAEKRQVLKGLRKELEESRASWNVVKAKTAESEEQWVKLKADFAERKRLLASSSESGFSDMEASTSTAEKSNNNEVVPASSSSVETKEVTEPLLLATHVEDDFEELSEEIPDPFSDDEGDIIELPNDPFLQQPIGMVTSITSMVNPDIEDEEEEEGEEKEDEGLTPIFVPSLSYLAQVPSELQAAMLGSEKGAGEDIFGEAIPSRERLEDTALEEVDGNVRDLITRLSSSTARGAFLANRLADIHRRIATGSSLTEHNDWFDGEEEETDVEPRETEYEDDMTAASPSLLSDMEELSVPEPLPGPNDVETGPPSDPSADETESKILDEEEEDADNVMLDELSRSSSPDSMVLAIDEAINILDPPRARGLPPPGLPSAAFLQHSMGGGAPLPQTHVPFVPLPEDDDDDNEENEGEDPTGRERVQNALGEDTSSAAVTRFLIKHLPKQLSQLRDEKVQLEDKIHDLELVVSEQRMQMAEHERRVEEALAAAKKMDHQLKKAEEEKKLVEEPKAVAERELSATFRVPVEVTQEEMLLTWTVENREERPCCFWLNYIPAGGDDCDSVILPCRAEDTTVLEPRGLRSSLQVECGHRGRYTLHIEGSGNRMPQVTVNLTPLAEGGETT